MKRQYSNKVSKFLRHISKHISHSQHSTSEKFKSILQVLFFSIKEEKKNYLEHIGTIQVNVVAK